jgi:spore coat protein U-like protein
MQTFHHGIRLVAAATLFGLAASASAQSTGTTTLTVSSTLSASCSVAAGALSFGTDVPTPMAAAIDAATTITATCSTGRPYTIALNQGAGAGATEAVRRMSGSGGTVEYSIYQDSGRTTVWGTGTAALSRTGTGLPQDLPVYGRMPIQNAAPGTYADSVTVTVTF